MPASRSATKILLDSGAPNRQQLASEQPPREDLIIPSAPLRPIRLAQNHSELLEWVKTDSSILQMIPPFYAYFPGEEYLGILLMHGCHMVDQSLCPSTSSGRDRIVTIGLPQAPDISALKEDVLRVTFSKNGTPGPYIKDVVDGVWSVVDKGHDAIIDNVHGGHYIRIVWPCYGIVRIGLPLIPLTRASLAGAIASAVLYFMKKLSPEAIPAHDMRNMYGNAVKNVNTQKLRLFSVSRYPGNNWVPSLGLDVDLDAMSLHDRSAME
ncbi:hypothetical protein BJ912DRAFT_87121 [Pholiota molesta]|nr:hypothetical protein BJ912DRAFT_87121 [Pholiota molesta]